MITAHRTQKPQKAQAGGPHVTNIPAQAQHPPQHLPASEIRVPYQSSAPPGQEVVQCCGFGKWLREIFCCGDTDVSELPQADGPNAVPEHIDSPPIDTKHTPPSRTDGPCAIAALKGLGWYSAEDEDKLRIQTAEFGELGRVLNDAATLSTLGQAMILFFYPGNSVPFHVMYTDSKENLCGENNCYEMLENNLCPKLSDFGQMEGKLLKIPFEHIEWILKDGITLKYVTLQQYQEVP